jgi:hypothetical protein
MNKYFYLLAASLLLFSTGRAQIKKGDWLLGGNLWFLKVDNDPVVASRSDATVRFISPSFGKAIGDNLVAGINLSFGYQKQVQQSANSPLYRDQYWNYYLAFFIRRYKDLGHNFSLFLEGDLGGAWGPEKGSFEGSNELYVDHSSYNISASLDGGLAYHLTHRWLLETGFQGLVYASYGQSWENGSIQSFRKASGFRMWTNLNRALSNFSIGCRYVL